MWTGKQALDRGLVDQLGGLGEAVAEAASRAKLGKTYPVRYVEEAQGSFEQFLINLNENAMVQAAQAYGVQLPAWVAHIDALAPELKLLRTAQAGRPNIYAYCFCTPH